MEDTLKDLQKEIASLKESLTNTEKNSTNKVENLPIPNNEPQNKQSSSQTKIATSTNVDNNVIKKRISWLSDLVASAERKAIVPVEKTLRTGSSEEKIMAIFHIAHYRERAGIPILLEALNDKEAQVRSLAAKTLGALGAVESVKKLLALLHDPEPIVRDSITQALTILTRERFVFFKDLSDEE